MKNNMGNLIARRRLLEIDHEPDGWPAIRMKDVPTLCDEIENNKRPPEVTQK